MHLKASCQSQLYWQSEPHHLYEIDEADALVNTNTGSITWNKLYDDYPSQGTNTLIGDSIIDETKL